MLPTFGNNRTNGLKSNSSPFIKTSGVVNTATNINNKLNNPRKSNMMDKVGMAAKAAQGLYNSAPQEVKDKINNGVRTAVQEGVSRRFATYEDKGNKRRHSSGFTLSEAPTPLPINLDTGVKPNTYTSDWMEAVYGKCAPLHMSCGFMSLPTSTTNRLYIYFTETLAFHLQTAAQSNVGFNLNINTDFTAANIFSATNALLYALQVYFYYSSILSYFSNPKNNNRGMTTLRRNFTPQLLEDLTLLERRLLDTPCPPNLLEFTRYLSGTFATSDMAGAPLIKLCPVAPSFTGVDVNAAKNALDGLQSGQNNGVFSLLRRAIPQWIPKALNAAPAEPIYDGNFKTIFANLPFSSFYSAATQYQPTVTDNTTPIQYNSFTETLDGAAYSLAGVFQGGGYSPCLWNVLGAAVARSSSSRISYYVDSSNLNNGFYGSDVDAYLARSRPETYQLNDAGNALVSLHLPGAQLCQIVTGDTIRETCNNVLEYLISSGTISNKSENAKFMPDRTGRRAKRRGK